MELKYTPKEFSKAQAILLEHIRKRTLVQFSKDVDENDADRLHRHFYATAIGQNKPFEEVFKLKKVIHPELWFHDSKEEDSSISLTEFSPKHFEVDGINMTLGLQILKKISSKGGLDYIGEIVGYKKSHLKQYLATKLKDGNLFFRLNPSETLIKALLYKIPAAFWFLYDDEVGEEIKKQQELITDYFLEEVTNYKDKLKQEK